MMLRGQYGVPGVEPRSVTLPAVLSLRAQTEILYDFSACVYSAP